MDNLPPLKDTWSSGEAYEPYVGRWSRLVAREFLDWLQVRHGARWLDVGCGTGALSQTILERGSPGSVKGVDSSTGFVAYARKNTPDERAEFEVGDAQNLPVETGSYDAVVSGLMLNFVPQPAVAAAEMARAARPGGVVAVYVWDYAGKMELMRHFWNAASDLDADAAALDEGRRFPLCQPEPLRTLLQAAGLASVEVRFIDIPTDFRDFDDFWTGFLGGQGPAPSYAQSLTEERRAALRERLRAALQSALDGSIHLVARAWAVRGRKEYGESALVGPVSYPRSDRDGHRALAADAAATPLAAERSVVLSGPPAVHEGFVPVPNAELYYRAIGEGRPIIILHGGPDFSHTYLLPDLDRLADSYCLIYYDQRGRGASGGEVLIEDVSINSEMEDLEAVREYFQLESAALLGHSWGGLLAMEYATRHPERVSQLILMNSAPASYHDRLLFLQHRIETAAADIEEMKAIATTENYQAGEIEAGAAYYRHHFRAAFRQPEKIDLLIENLRKNFTPEGIVKARRIEQRLYEQTWSMNEYNVLPRLTRLLIPVLVMHGDSDFNPLQCAAHIAEAIPGARLAVIQDCGHFAYIESPEQVHGVLDTFFAPL